MKLRSDVDYYEIETRLEEISTGLMVFSDVMENELSAAEKSVGAYVGYAVGIMPMLHMIMRSVSSLQEDIRKETKQ